MKKCVFALWICMVCAQPAISEQLPTFTRIILSDPLLGAQPAISVEKGYGFLVTTQQSDGVRSSLHWISIDFKGRQMSRGLISEGDARFVNWADTPGIAVLDNGDWVAFWLERNDPDAPEGYDVKLVRSTDRGRTWSQPISPHRDGTKTQHGFVSLVPDGDDRVLIAWLDGRLATISPGTHSSHDHESAPMTLRSAVINRANEILEEATIDNRTCSCCQTDLVRLGEATLLAYRDRSIDEIRDISISRRIAGRWGRSDVVNHDGWRIEGCPVNGPALAVNDKLGIVFWPTLIKDVMALRYKVIDDLSASFSQTDVHTLNLPYLPSGRVDAAPWKSGFLLTWVSRARDRPSVDLAYIDTGGKATLAPPMAEPNLRGRATGFPRIASDGSRALLVWPESDHGAPVIGMGLIE